MPGTRKMTTWVNEGVEVKVKAYWVGERTWGLVRTGREGRTRAKGSEVMGGRRVLGGWMGVKVVRLIHGRYSCCI